MHTVPIRGQERPLKLLEEEFVVNRRTGSYLFEGPKSVGKHTAAKQLIGKLLCTNPLAQPCGECPGCSKWRRLAHPDVLSMAPIKGVISIDSVRDCLQHLLYPPLEASMRFVLIDDADAMNNFAANALLKTLEEPPPNVVIILISSRPTTLPVTVLSRLKRIRFAPLSPETRAQLLGVRDFEAALLALGDDDSEGAEVADRLKSLGKQRQALLQGCKNAFAVQGDRLDIRPEGLWEIAGELLAEDDSLISRLNILKSIVRDLYYLRNNVEGSFITHRDQLDFLKPVADRLRPQPLERLLDKSETIVASVQRLHVNHKVAVEYMMSAVEELQ